MQAETKEVTDVQLGEAFLESLQLRDFNALFRTFGPDMRTRALLPGGPVEVHGAVSTTDLFAGWFQDVDDFEVQVTHAGKVADRLSLQWRFHLRWPGEPFLREIEQTAYAKVANGTIVVLDMVCSGFRPLSTPAPMTGAV
jgi:limonene-1,2-epoxide hydrolase